MDVMYDAVRVRTIRKIAQIQNIFHMNADRKIPPDGILISVYDFRYAAANGAKTQNSYLNHVKIPAFL